MDAWLVALIAGAVICAAQAVRARGLLTSAIWLAGLSALTSIVLYLLGAREVAVIELSVGAGLVTVLFVFAISIAGEDAIGAEPLMPRGLALGLVTLAAALLVLMAVPALGVTVSITEDSFAQVHWDARGLDVLVQVMLIYCGVLGVLGVLSGAGTDHQPAAQVGLQQEFASDPAEAEPESALEEVQA